jgi:hypothetical protein
LIRALHGGDDREALVREFQRQVWDSEGPEDAVWEVLGDLAYDLEFWVPNPEWRKEDLSYYGDERLEAEIRSALDKLDNLGVGDPESD